MGTFIAGRYSSTYAAADLGIMEGGYEVSWSYSQELIDNTDLLGDSVIDGVYRGGNVFIQGTAKEYKTGSLAATTPWGALAPTGASGLNVGVISRLASDVAGILVLTATAATPAAATPATLTATFAILSENFDVRTLLDSRLRKVPFRFRILPYLATVYKWFTTT